MVLDMPDYHRMNDDVIADCHLATVARAERAEAERDRLLDAQRWRSVKDEPPPVGEYVLLRDQGAGAKIVLFDGRQPRSYMAPGYAVWGAGETDMWLPLSAAPEAKP